jgi:hypothetical protein
MVQERREKAKAQGEAKEAKGKWAKEKMVGVR